MASILVRNLDDAVVARLKQIATSRGTSLEQLAREKLAEASHESHEALVRRITERAARMPAQTEDSTDIIRAMRDGRIRG